MSCARLVTTVGKGNFRKTTGYDRSRAGGTQAGKLTCHGPHSKRQRRNYVGKFMVEDRSEDTLKKVKR